MTWHASWAKYVCRKAQKAEGDLRRATADLRAREREREAAESRAAAAQAESEKGSSSSSAAVAAKRVRHACLYTPLCCHCSQRVSSQCLLLSLPWATCICPCLWSVCAVLFVLMATCMSPKLGVLLLFCVGLLLIIPPLPDLQCRINCHCRLLL